MVYAQVEEAARNAYERGDAIAALRLHREFLQTGPAAIDAGRSHTAVAEIHIRVGAMGAARIRAELAQARQLLAGNTEHLPLALLTSMLAACAENNEAEATRWHREYVELCKLHPRDPALTRWRGRFTHMLGRLARARSAHRVAIRYYQQAIAEYRRFEPDRQTARMLTRVSESWIAWHLLRAGDVAAARHYLDACDGTTFSAAWEAVRACCEVEYHLAAGNLERAQFWLNLARMWQHSSVEAVVRITYCRALLARARGHQQRAAELAAQARQEAARFKQDHFLPEIVRLLQELRGEAPAAVPPSPAPSLHGLDKLQNLQHLAGSDPLLLHAHAQGLEFVVLHGSHVAPVACAQPHRR